MLPEYPETINICPGIVQNTVCCPAPVPIVMVTIEALASQTPK